MMIYLKNAINSIVLLQLEFLEFESRQGRKSHIIDLNWLNFYKMYAFQKTWNLNILS